MSYRVEIEASAWKELMKLPQPLQERILTAIEGLEESPRPSGVKKLQARNDVYRIRVGGDHRVIYTIQDDVLLVLIVKIGDRKDVYR